MTSNQQQILECHEAYLFIPGKCSHDSPEAFVTIPMRSIIWVANIEVKRLDIGVTGGLVHLFETLDNKNHEAEKLISQSAKNLLGPAYWVDADVGELWQDIEHYLKGETGKIDSE